MYSTTTITDRLHEGQRENWKYCSIASFDITIYFVVLLLICNGSIFDFRFLDSEFHIFIPFDLLFAFSISDCLFYSFCCVDHFSMKIAQETVKYFVNDCNRLTLRLPFTPSVHFAQTLTEIVTYMNYAYHEH